ncbi:MAG: glycerophosphodiester phosphodiesterase family protein [Bacteroidota bacterium]
MTAKTLYPPGEVIIVAHRGFSGGAPENTYTAFSLAADLGVEAAECDVRLSYDQEVVIIHDRTVNRTTNGHGAVNDIPLKYLQSLDAGSWFHRRFSGERILTLDESLDILQRFQWINIEIKTDGISRREAGILIEKTTTRILHRKLEDKVIISSFYHPILVRSRIVAPQIRTAVLYHAILHGSHRPSTLVKRVGAWGFVGGKHEIFAPMLRNARQNNIPVFVFTLNTERDLHKWIKRGVTGVVTNFPDRALKVRKILKTG